MDGFRVSDRYDSVVPIKGSQWQSGIDGGLRV